MINYMHSFSLFAAKAASKKKEKWVSNFWKVSEKDLTFEVFYFHLVNVIVYENRELST